MTFKPFSILIFAVVLSCSNNESTTQPLIGKWIEQNPISSRTQLIFESDNLFKVILDNEESILSYTIVDIQKDSIELSDNLADMNNNLKLYFKVTDNETITIESFYSDENTNMTFEK